MYINLENTRKVSLVLVASALLTTVFIYGCARNGTANTDPSASLTNNSAKPVPPATATTVVSSATVATKGNEDLSKIVQDIKTLMVENNAKKDKELEKITSRVEALQRRQFGVSDDSKFSLVSANASSGLEAEIGKLIAMIKKDTDSYLAKLAALSARISEIESRSAVCCNSGMMVSPKKPRKRVSSQTVASAHTKTSEARASASASVNSSSASASAKMEGEVVSVKMEGNIQTIISKTATGEHKWKDIATNRSRCNLRNNGVIMETVFRANEAECDLWQHGRAVELGFIVPQGGVSSVPMSMSSPVVMASSATQNTRTADNNSSATCNFKLNGNVVAMTTAVDEAGCNTWQREEARRRGLAPK